MKLAEILLFTIIFLALLGFIIWVVALLKPKVLPPLPLPEPAPPLRPVVDLTEQELLDAQTELQLKLRQVRSMETLAALRQRLADVDKRLLALKTPPAPSATPPSSN